ncbi:leucine-rich repeat protein [Butyrivibrio sp. JL13D10]|uniref:leucine-rich repeat protein n=1 Tax=Butyrivibrio sp. JL13D10 TaxID=3236815 RepID=UPI0038B46BFA
MKKVFCNLLLGFIIALFWVVIFIPLKAEAMYVADATDNSITVDWSDDYRELMNEWKQKGVTSWKFNSANIKYMEIPCDYNVLNNQKGISINFNGNTKRHTITNLKPGTGYRMMITVDHTFKGKVNGIGERSYDLREAYTTNGAASAKASVLGTTGTTADFDLKGLFSEIEHDNEKKGAVSCSISNVTVGYADEADGKDAAIKNAKNMTGTGEYALMINQYNYSLRGLKPDHSYTVVFGFDVSASYFISGKKTTKKYHVYSLVQGVKTKNYDDSNLFKAPEPKPVTDWREDIKSDSSVYELSSFGYSDYSFNFETTKNSITIKWDQPSDKDWQIVPAKNEKKICLSIVEEKNFDPDEDRKKYGSLKNYGPNVREAIKKADARPVRVDFSKKSYTFKNLKSDTHYLVMFKCGQKYKSGGSSSICYFYKSNVFTEGDNGPYDIWALKDRQTKKPFMYDVLVKRNGKEAYLDWGKALSAYYSQPFMKEHFAKLWTKNNCEAWRTRDLRITIGYAKLPNYYNESKVIASYDEARRMDKRNCICIDSYYTNCMIYGLDPKANYVYAISFESVMSDYNTISSFYGLLYADENGMNYYKAEELGESYRNQFKDVEYVDDNPGDNSNAENGDAPGNSNGEGKPGKGDSKSKTVDSAALPMTVDVDGITYNIGIDGNATVTKIGPVKKAIINEVTVSGATYPVTAIADSAAKGNKKLQNLTISSNVKTIGKKAFYGCKKLKKVTIKANKSLTVGKKAFRKLPKGVTIYVKGVKGQAKKKLVRNIKKQTNATVK